MPRLQAKSFATPDSVREMPRMQDRVRHPRRRDDRVLRVRARLALVDRRRPAVGRRLLPDPPRRVRDLGRDPRRDGRRPDPRRRTEQRVRDPAGTRQVGRRRRALGHARLGGERTGSIAATGRDRHPDARDGDVHRHRRLDRDAQRDRGRGLARSPGASQRATCAWRSTSSTGARSRRPATGSSPCSTARRGRPCCAAEMLRSVVGDRPRDPRRRPHRRGRGHRQRRPRDRGPYRRPDPRARGRRTRRCSRHPPPGSSTDRGCPSRMPGRTSSRASPGPARSRASSSGCRRTDRESAAARSGRAYASIGPRRRFRRRPPASSSGDTTGSGAGGTSGSSVWSTSPERMIRWSSASIAGSVSSWR